MATISANRKPGSDWIQTNEIHTAKNRSVEISGLNISELISTPRQSVIWTHCGFKLCSVLELFDRVDRVVLAQLHREVI